MGRPRKLSEKQEDEIVALYLSGASGCVSARRLNLTPFLVYETLRRRSIPRRPLKIYQENSGFFTIIDSDEKAYWLGFIAADGPASDHFSLSLALHVQDLGHLEKFKKSIESNRPIYQSTQIEHAAIQVNDKQIVSDLIKLGITPRKCHTLRFPALSSSDLDRAFIRGYFDGDGSILCLEGNLHLEFAGNEQFLTRVQKILVQSCYLNFTKISKCQNSKATFRLRYGGNSQVPRILHFLYKGASIYLERKAQFYFNLGGGQLSLPLEGI